MITVNKGILLKSLCDEGNYSVEVIEQIIPKNFSEEFILGL